MGIFGALTTAVSGLRAQSYALENISGNIANSQTPGFKRVETSFVDMIPELPAGREIAGSVSAFSRLTNTIKGDPNATGIATNVAINGEGFFVVQERVGYSDTKPVFGGTDLYTRRGDFQLDKDGYLVNGAGFYLRGTTIDPVTGQVQGSANDVIRLSSEPIPSKKTNSVLYQANLPTRPATQDAISTDPNSVLFTGAGSVTSPIPAGSWGAPEVGVAADDETTFLRQSVSGGAVTVYNDVGTPVDVQLRWAKIANGPDQWNLFYLQDGDATGTAVKWRNVGAVVQFDGQGAMLAPHSIDIPDLRVDDVTITGLNLNFGARGLTQYSTSSGLVQASTIQQDGYPSGTLSSVSVTSDGRIVGNYTNGQTIPVAEIPDRPVQRRQRLAAPRQRRLRADHGIGDADHRPQRLEPHRRLCRKLEYGHRRGVLEDDRDAAGVLRQHPRRIDVAANDDGSHQHDPLEARGKGAAPWD